MDATQKYCYKICLFNNETGYSYVPYYEVQFCCLCRIYVIDTVFFIVDENYMNRSTVALVYGDSLYLPLTRVIGFRKYRVKTI